MTLKHGKKIERVHKLIALLAEEGFSIEEAASVLSGAYLQALSQFKERADAVNFIEHTHQVMVKHLNQFYDRKENET